MEVVEAESRQGVHGRTECTSTHKLEHRRKKEKPAKPRQASSIGRERD